MKTGPNEQKKEVKNVTFNESLNEINEYGEKDRIIKNTGYLSKIFKFIKELIDSS